MAVKKPVEVDKYGVNTDAAVQAYYQELQRQNAQQLQDQANRQIQERNTSASKAQNENFINYMMAQKALPEQMARMGLSGGATESSRLRQNLNYQNTRYGTEQARQGDVNTINQRMNDSVNAYNLQSQQAMRNELAQNAAMRYERQQAEQHYADQMAQQRWSNQMAKKQFKQDVKNANRSYKLEKDKFKASKSNDSYEKMVNRVNTFGTTGAVDKRIKAINKKISDLNKKAKKAKGNSKKKLKAQIKSLKSEKALLTARGSAIVAQERAMKK